MRILIATPAAPGTTHGNRITAERYAGLLTGLGHVVEIVTELASDAMLEFDLLIALHAGRSSAIVKLVADQRPGCPVVVVMTGTDLHCDFSSDPRIEMSLRKANRIVLLEPEGVSQLPEWASSKTQVVFQSASSVADPPALSDDLFEVTLIGHLRAEKDPFLVTRSLELLPKQSRIQVTHIGDALAGEYEQRATEATERCARYQWIGNRSYAETQRRLAGSHLALLTSIVEGAPSVISEAAVNNVAILTTRIPASIGLLGSGYPGLFDVGDAKGLAQALSLAESDPAFYKSLKESCQKVKWQFDPETERNSLRQMLNAMNLL
ncbi:MAG: selenoneine biosynthesis selenosugar synthase SenB [Rubripirellula sp.]